MAAARSGSRSLIVVSTLAVAAVALAATLGLFWQRERQHAHSLSTRVDVTRAQLHSTQSRLKLTEAKLAATKSLSEKRRGVLLKAKGVLAQVDPLLSSVDGVQARAGDLQRQGDALSGDAEGLIQTTITLVNYLVQTDASYIDNSYVNDLIDQANTQLDGVRADETLFAAGDARYSGASVTFGHKADAFSSAVRQLQQQLKGVVAP